MNNTFHILDQFLCSNEPFWRFEPFHQSFDEPYPWCESHPGLSAWLDSLTIEQIEHFKLSPNSLAEPLYSYFPALREVNKRIDLPLNSEQAIAVEPHLYNGIPGRKLNQILSMGYASAKLHKGSEWLEWCSGKGYLGRILASTTGEKVTSFEFQQSLCLAGQECADHLELPMTFVQGDALTDESLAYINSNQHAVALHACGDLHVSLLSKAAAMNLPAVTISPCCYHLIGSDRYQPMSQLAQSSPLALNQQELRIPLLETVTGGERVKRHRFLEMSYRLSFDLMLRELKLTTTYIPIPSVKKSQLSLGFEAFCYWAASQKSIELPNVDFNRFLELGIQRFWHMERLSLVQQAFRRPLELWLVLDKALFLEQHGYQVTLSQFCSRETTPRNILLHAYRD
ncbi:methyltransferase [Vibrio genomosp. F10]|uniref:methyltransferase n=1 Tax=Vibrio genomosp. F10 TaxID=723171 RepID=UPI0002FAACB6|nr:methyltransferase [Vibrio genomosp. F10]OEF10385.1 SAM-dependent methyltransferase [Vibrio genomosp. F10 str. 9ZB36]